MMEKISNQHHDYTCYSEEYKLYRKNIDNNLLEILVQSFYRVFLEDKRDLHIGLLLIEGLLDLKKDDYISEVKKILLVLKNQGAINQIFFSYYNFILDKYGEDLIQKEIRNLHNRIFEIESLKTNITR